MAKTTYSQIAKALYLLAKECDEKEFKKMMPQFVSYLAEKGMLRQAERIFNALDRVYAQEENHLSLKVVSRYGLTEKQLHAISKQYKEKSKAKKVDVVNEINEEILGGYKIRVQDLLIDHTLNNNLAQLNAAMLKGKK